MNNHPEFPATCNDLDCCDLSQSILNQSSMNFDKLLEILADLPMIPADALDQITETIEKNFPNFFDNDLDIDR